MQILNHLWCAAGASWERKKGLAGEGPMQGTLQLGSSTQTWKDLLGEVDVGRWQLIYRWVGLLLCCYCAVDAKDSQGCFAHLLLSCAGNFHLCDVKQHVLTARNNSAANADP